MSVGTSGGGNNVRLRSTERKPYPVTPITKLPNIEDNGALWINDALFYPEREKLAVFIDGPSIHHAIKRSRGSDPAVGPRVELDYKRLKRFFASLGQLHSLSFYAVNSEADKVSIRPLLDWMDYHGYRVVLRAPRIFVDDAGKEKEKRSLDVEIAVDMLRTAIGSDVDHIVLFSTDGDFCSVVQACQQQNCRVTVISVTHLASNDLRRAANAYLDIAEILPLVEKTDKSDDGTERAA